MLRVLDMVEHVSEEEVRVLLAKESEGDANA
jgi:hypothetical protein